MPNRFVAGVIDSLALMDQFGGCFARRDPASAGGGIRPRIARRSGAEERLWQLAEHLGREKPYGIQRLLGRASWNAEQVRDELVRYATAHLVTDKDPGVLIVDETGFLKKGKSPSACNGSTAARPDESRTFAGSAFFLALSTSWGRALIDRALYLPQVWCDDKPRRDEAGVPEAVEFVA